MSEIALCERAAAYLTMTAGMHEDASQLAWTKECNNCDFCYRSSNDVSVISGLELEDEKLEE